MSETPKRKFSDPVFIGGGVMLDHDTQTYIPYKWVGKEMVKGEPVPFPETEEEMERLHTMADGMFNPPASEPSGERVISFSIFQDVVANDGRGYRLNGVPITDEEADKLWEQSPDNPKNKKEKP